MKMRTDSIINQLADDQRADLYEWLSQTGVTETQRRAQKPIPEGGLNRYIHQTTLRRFLESETKRLHAEELAELAASCDLSSGASGAVAGLPPEISQLIAAAKVDFAHAIYALAKNGHEPKNFDKLARVMRQIEMAQLKREQLELQKQQLQLARERAQEQTRQWEYDNTRKLMAEFVALQKIHHAPGLDQHSKVWLARDHCFGHAPIDFNDIQMSPSDTLRNEAAQKNTIHTDSHNNSPSGSSGPSVVQTPNPSLTSLPVKNSGAMPVPASTFIPQPSTLENTHPHANSVSAPSSLNRKPSS